MSGDEIPPSSHAADQAWSSLLLINDPNAALVGALRPVRLHPLTTALLGPSEHQAQRSAPVASGAVEQMEQIPGLRPRPARWLAAGLLLALGIGLAGLTLETSWGARAEAPAAAAPSHGERFGTTTLETPAAPSTEVANGVGETLAVARMAGSVPAWRHAGDAAETADLARTAREHAPAHEEATAAPPRAPTARAHVVPSWKNKARTRRARRVIAQARTEHRSTAR